MDTYFRTLNARDWEELERLAAVIWHQCYRELLGQQQISYMLEKFLTVEVFKRQEEEGYVYRGLFVNGEMIGFTASYDEGERVFLSKLYLREDYHHQGLGRKMLADVIGLYPGRDELYLTVNKYNRAYEMYRHLGFEVSDAVVTDIGAGYVMDDYVMHLDLRKAHFSV